MLWEIRFPKDDVIEAAEEQAKRAAKDEKEYKAAAELEQATVGSVTYYNASLTAADAARRFRFWVAVLEQSDEAEVALTQGDMEALGLTLGAVHLEKEALKIGSVQSRRPLDG